MVLLVAVEALDIDELLLAVEEFVSLWRMMLLTEIGMVMDCPALEHTSEFAPEVLLAASGKNTMQS